MHKKTSINNQGNLQQNQPDIKENDFFNQLQEKEKKEGNKARGGGHGWTTFVELLLGDW